MPLALRPLFSLPSTSLRCASAAGARRLRVHATGGDEAPSLPDTLATLVGDRVDELLLREENRPLLEGLEAASIRVDRARDALAEIEREEAEARRAADHVRRLERRQSEIAESQRELAEVRALLEEAERALSSTFTNKSNVNSSEEIGVDAERLESLKAAIVASIVGGLASLPISLYRAADISQIIIESSAVLISCALFGITFRYAVRRDLDNVQLKTGVAAAFAFVRGLAEIQVPELLELSGDDFAAIVIDGSLHVVANIFIFLFAAIALDFCFKSRVVSPFPMGK